MKYIFSVLILTTITSFGQVSKVAYSDGTQQLEGYFAKSKKPNPKKIEVKRMIYGLIVCVTKIKFPL